MLFLSQLLNRYALDLASQRTGRVYDLEFRLGDPFPQVTGVVLRLGVEKRIVPWDHVGRLDAGRFNLRVPRVEVFTFPHPSPDTNLLGLDVMDSQVVDINGARVYRVNDVQLNFLGHQLWVVGVDIGFWGIARRIGLAPVLAWLESRIPWKVPEGIVRWDLVDPMEKEISKVRLRVSHDRLTRLHPADLADVVEEMGYDQRSWLLQEMDDAQIADLVEESSPEMQAHILEELGTDRAADILEEMEPDEAADLLAELPEKRARQLIGLMDTDEATEVKELLSYDEGTVGAMMTTSYLEAPADWTARNALTWYKERHRESEVYVYIYVVEKSGSLTGAVSIRSLLVSDPEVRLRDLVSSQTYSIQVDESPEHAVEKLVRYKLMALPVLDGSGRLVGVVAVHDILDFLLPKQDR